MGTEVEWDKLVRVKKDKLFYNVSGGISSKKTLFNYIFKAGGDSKIPLNTSFSDLLWEIDGGGLVFDTTFGIMRLDIGLDNLKEKPKYYINFEYNF